jgi:hypothetical protein
MGTHTVGSFSDVIQGRAFTMFKRIWESGQQDFGSLQTRQKILLGFSVPMILMTAIAVMVYFSVRTMQQDAQWVQHTQDVITGGQELMALIVNMETGERGFLITGKEPFLKPFVAAQENLLQRNWLAGTQINDFTPLQNAVVAIQQQGVEFESCQSVCGQIGCWIGVVVAGHEIMRGIPA